MADLSVIIPLAQNEGAWRNLLGDLSRLPVTTQIIFAIAQGTKAPAREELALPQRDVSVVSAAPGRAEQMNAGARVAQGDFLWFVHADSRFSPAVPVALQRAIATSADHLFYFELAFLADASWLMQLNSWGVRLRSHLLKVPFGDQGFCLRRELFNQLGGFPEGLACGEDHIFVWRARQRGVRLQSVSATLYTSARKYRAQGWLRTTLRHQYLWLKQAWPEWRRLRRGAGS